MSRVMVLELHKMAKNLVESGAVAPKNIVSPTSFIQELKSCFVAIFFKLFICYFSIFWLNIQISVSFRVEISSVSSHTFRNPKRIYVTLKEVGKI